MAKISISYRRADSEAMTGRIFDRLINHYGKEAIFRDIEDIPAGIDFRQHINETLLKTDVLLAIVGRKWLGAARGGLERINEESDPVRVEVETALRRRLPIIPVLIGNTRMPGSDQLPPSLKDFAFRNAVKVDTGRDFDHHIEHLIASIDAILNQGAPKAPTAPKSPPSRETNIAESGQKQSLKAEKPAPAPINLDAQRKRDTGSRSTAPSPPAPPARPRSPQIQALLATTPAAPSLDRDSLVWPKSRQGRMLRLAGVGVAAIVVIAFLVPGILPGGSGSVRHQFSLQNPGPVSALAFSPDSQMIAAASLDHSVNIWNIGSKSLLASLSAADSVSSVAFMPDGREVVYGALNGSIMIANADASGQIVHTLKPGMAYSWQTPPRVWSIAVSPDGTRVVGGNDDGSVKIWSADGELLHDQANHSDAVMALAFFPDGKTFASGSKDGTVRFWNTDSGNATQTLTDHTGQILSVAVSPDGNSIAGAGSGNSVLIWNASGNVAQALTSSLDTINAIAFSPDGSRLFVAGNDASIEIWDVASGQRAQTVSGNSRNIRALVFAQDGGRFVSGGDDKMIDVWSGQ